MTGVTSEKSRWQVLSRGTPFWPQVTTLPLTTFTNHRKRQIFGETAKAHPPLSGIHNFFNRCRYNVFVARDDRMEALKQVR